MDIFVWDEKFITGLTQVDEQHHQLAILFNEFSNSFYLLNSYPKTDLSVVFARVVDYTRYHFQDEEALMRAEGVDARHVYAHTALHTQFVAQAQLMWERQSLMSNPDESLVAFLTSWLGLHSLGIDQSMARQIHLIRQGIPAPTAFDRDVHTYIYGEVDPRVRTDLMSV